MGAKQKNKEMAKMARQLVEELEAKIYYLLKQGVEPDKISNFLISLEKEMDIEFNPKDTLLFEKGDIVLCNYGKHPNGEISGAHKLSIICNIDGKGRPFVVPVAKHKKFQYKHAKGFFWLKEKECTYDIDYEYKSGTIYLYQGRYVRPERIKKVLGHVNEKYMKRILEELTNSFDFKGNTEKYAPIVQTIEVMEQKLQETPPPVCKKPKKDYLLEFFNWHKEQIFQAPTMEAKIPVLLDCMEYPKQDPFIIEFIQIGCKQEKPSYASILSKMGFDIYMIRKKQYEMRIQFSKWIQQKHPDIKKQYPSISWIDFIKVFANYQ